MWLRKARLLAVLAGGAALGVPGAVVLDAGPETPAVAQVRGITVAVTELPDRFVGGAGPETLTVVATKRGGGCLKVRWSMLLEVDGLTLEQVRVDRVEQDGSFPVDVVTEGSVARFTDERLDPGTLCRGRTVTARYEIDVAGDVGSGRLTVLNEAYDSDVRLLARAGATREVVPDPDRAPAEDEDAGRAEPAPGDAGPAGEGSPPEAGADVDQAADAREGIPLAWFLIGALMVFFGLSLLLNVRFRQRVRDEQAEELPVGDRLSHYRTVPRRPRPRPHARQRW